MNERIKELAYQAGLYYYPRGTCCMDEMFPRHFNVAEADEAYTKFAELIVKECVTVLNNRFMGDMNREDLEVRRCVVDIKEHFGVEE